MSTDETTTPNEAPTAEPAAPSAAPVEPTAQAAAEAAPSAEGQSRQAEDGSAEAPRAEGEAQPSEGAAAGEAAGAAAGDAPQKRKRRRRRKKKPAEGVTAGAEGAAAEDGEAGDEAEDGEAGEGEGAASEGGEGASAGAKSGEKRREKKPKGPPREKPPFAVGEEVISRVTKVMEHAIMLDVSGKALGIIDKEEIPESQWPKEDEKLIAKVSNDGSRGGLVVLTHDLNRWQKARVEVEAAFTHKQPVAGLITGVIKGGIEVDVGGLRGFAPASHVDLRLGADLHHLIGQKLPFDVVQFQKRGREFVLSRKSALESEAAASREEKLKAIEPGAVVTGVVRSITQFGAFVDVGGIDGLVHATEASHTGAPLREIFKVGQETTVKILKIDEKGKVWLSKKATEEDPWVAAAERFTRGSRHTGKVVRLAPFGAFIELATGIDGLLHVSDISPGKRIAHPSDVLKVGQEMEVVIANADAANHKLGLHPAPPEGELPKLEEGQAAAPAPRLQLHQHVKCVVESQEVNGLQVRIVGQTGRMSKAFIPAAATNTSKGTDLRKAFPAGKELDAKIIELDPRRGSIRLSIKALTQDEERQSFKKYQNEVKQASKFGTFGDLLREKGITK
jgi:small subunit ribosomal protein S1